MSGAKRSSVTPKGSTNSGVSSHLKTAPLTKSGATGHSVTTKGDKPSSKLNPKTIDPFNDAAMRSTTFSLVYNGGGVPCRLVHGSVKHKLQWDQPPESLPFDPLLVYLAEGLRESIHPYAFIARQGFRELLQVPNAGFKATPILPRLNAPLRAALSHSDVGVFEAGLDGLVHLSNAVGPELTVHLKILLVPISKKMMDKKCREKIVDSLNIVEQNGGKDALMVIKNKIPTYSSVLEGQ